MAIEPGWVFLSVALAFQCSLVSLLILPAPNNNVRGAVTQWVAKLTHSGAVRFGLLGVVAMSAFYLWYVRDALLNPLLFLQDQFGFDGVLLAKKGFGGCEMEIEAFKAERNALICAANLFVYLVLHRLTDIQTQLHQQRAVAKAAGGAPMKVPMGSKVD